VRHIRRHLTYANVMATIAVFLALGGGAYAALRVTSANIVNKTIRGKDVKPNTLGGKQVNEANLRLPQVRAGIGDDTSVPGDVILNFPSIGLRVETDGDSDDVNALVLRNTNGPGGGDINYVTNEGGGSSTIFAGDTSTYVPTNRVVDITAARYTATLPTRAVHINCGFPIGAKTFCVGIDIKP
jgi:hypothetical protein